MRTPVHRELDAWGWYVDRLADIAIGKAHGDITDAEYRRYRRMYLGMWHNHGVT